MKKAITIILLLISLNGISQKVNQDSLQKAYNKFSDSLIKKTSIEQYRQWLYTNITAEKYNEFLQILNAYVQQQFTKPKQK